MIELFTKDEYIKAKSTDLLPCKCYYCSKPFYKEKKLITSERGNSRGRVRYCNTECLRLDKTKSILVTCKNCDKEFEKKLSQVGENNFCTKSCTAKYNNKFRVITEEQKIKIRESLKKYHDDLGVAKNRNYVNKNCVCCNKEFKRKKITQMYCSRECVRKHKPISGRISPEQLSSNGRKAASSQQRRSKNEIYFGELCSKQFDNILYNEIIFNGWDADIILPDLKIAILWNGAWHYKKITEKHSLEQVQNRDRIKINEIKKAGYTPYIICDMGKFKKSFVEEQFKLFIDSI